CDGARRVSSPAGEIRAHPGRAGAARVAPWARTRQHGLGAGPRRGGDPRRCREIVRRTACRRRELHGAAQLNHTVSFFAPAHRVRGGGLRRRDRRGAKAPPTPTRDRPPPATPAPPAAPSPTRALPSPPASPRRERTRPHRAP